MPSFKPKSAKKIKIFKNYLATLDTKHNECVSEFNVADQTTIPQLEATRAQLRLQLKEQKMTLEQRLDIRDTIKEIGVEIRDLRLKRENYVLDNSKYIFEYFEDKKDITNVDMDKEKPVKQPTSKTQILYNLFKVKNATTPESSAGPSASENTVVERSCDIVQKYMMNIDDSFLDMNAFIRDTSICQSCYRGELVPIEDEGVLICNSCAVGIPYLIENEKPSYKEPPKEVCFYAYKKINHFKEIIAQFQGKETTQIADDVIEQIRQQIKKERIDISQLSYMKMKEMLKKLGLNKYYEHIAFIRNKFGIPPPIFSPALEETLCNLFIETQSPYAKRCPDYRVNYLNYFYVLFKFCELLDEQTYLPEIPLLKDREKLIEQDEIWKRICIELDWEFIPTV